MMVVRCRSPRRGWGHLWDALNRLYEVLGFEAAIGGDEEVFRALVLARLQATRAGEEARRDPVDHLTERHAATGRGLTGRGPPPDGWPR